MVPTALVTGPPGVGKTTVGAEISAILHDPPVPHAFVDVDQLAWCFPPPPDDWYQQKLALRNLAAVWRNHRAAGATHLILARVVESRAELRDYQQALPDADITIVRLRAPIAVLEERIRLRRHAQDTSWHIARARELSAQMDAQPVEDLLIETAERLPYEIAREIVRTLGWPRL